MQNFADDLHVQSLFMQNFADDALLEETSDFLQYWNPVITAGARALISALYYVCIRLFATSVGMPQHDYICIKIIAQNIYK